MLNTSYKEEMKRPAIIIAAVAVIPVTAFFLYYFTVADRDNENEEMTFPVTSAAENGSDRPIEYAKPVICLYPTKETVIKVMIGYDGILMTTYPAYKNGWYVTAMPDGTLISKDDGREYPCLFWEGANRSQAS